MPVKVILSFIPATKKQRYILRKVGSATEVGSIFQGCVVIQVGQISQWASAKQAGTWTTLFFGFSDAQSLALSLRISGQFSARSFRTIKDSCSGMITQTEDL